MIPYYILENGLPKKTDMMTWSRWVESHPNREVNRTIIPEHKVQIITVFFPLPELDIDCSDLESEKEPREIIWFYGTMVFGGPMAEHEIKYRTQEEAEDGHEKIVAKVKAVLAGEEEKPDCCGGENPGQTLP